jgi:hypothetical protein
MRVFLILAAVGAASALPVIATAQTDASPFARDRNVSVKERPRPAYDALGIQLGSFLVYPKIEATVSHLDNVFATATNEVSDTVITAGPSVRAVSQWSNHELEVHANANVFKYDKVSSQDNSTYSVGGSGRIDVVRGFTLSPAVSFSHRVVPGTSAEAPDLPAEGIEYNETAFGLAAARESGLVRLEGRVAVRKSNFANTRLQSGAVFNTGYRDNTYVEGEVRAGYAVSPALSVYVAGVTNDWNFKNNLITDINRDASGYQVVVGSNFDVSRLARGEIQVGYLNQNFSDPRAGDVDGLAVRGKVEYFPTQLITLTAAAERAVRATGVIGAAAAVHSEVSVQADYELLRNVILSAGVLKARDNYRGSDRRDDVTGMSLGGQYLLNRNLGVNVIFNRDEQDSSGLQRGRDFTADRLQFGLVLQR